VCKQLTPLETRRPGEKRDKGKMAVKGKENTVSAKTRETLCRQGDSACVKMSPGKPGGPKEGGTHGGTIHTSTEPLKLAWGGPGGKCQWGSLSPSEQGGSRN